MNSVRWGGMGSGEEGRNRTGDETGWDGDRARQRKIKRGNRIGEQKG